MRELQTTEADRKRERELPKDFRALSKEQYLELRTGLEENPGRVNRGMVRFLRELDGAWFGNNRPVGLFAKFFARKILEDSFAALRENRVTPERSRYINALLALHDCGIVRDDVTALGAPRTGATEDVAIDMKRTEEHIEAFLAFEKNRRLGQEDESLERLKEKFADRPTFVQMIGTRFRMNVSKFPITEREMSDELERMHDLKVADLEEALRSSAEAAPRSELDPLTAVASELVDTERLIRAVELAIRGMREPTEETGVPPNLEINPDATNEGLKMLTVDVQDAKEHLRMNVEHTPKAVSHPLAQAILNNVQKKAEELSERLEQCAAHIRAAGQGKQGERVPMPEKEAPPRSREVTEDFEGASETEMARIIGEMEQEQAELLKEGLELPPRIQEHLRAFREARDEKGRRAAFGALHAFIVRE